MNISTVPDLLSGAVLTHQNATVLAQFGHPAVAEIESNGPFAEKLFNVKTTLAAQYPQTVAMPDGVKTFPLRDDPLTDVGLILCISCPLKQKNTSQHIGRPLGRQSDAAASNGAALSRAVNIALVVAALCGYCFSAGVALAFQDFVDSALVDAEGRGDAVLVLALPMAEPDLYGIVGSKLV